MSFDPHSKLGGSAKQLLSEKTKKYHPFQNDICINSVQLSANIKVIGGGEESRTPVQQAFHTNFFEHSLFYLFLIK